MKINSQDLRTEAEAALFALFLSYGWRPEFCGELASSAIDKAIDTACND